MTKIQREIGVFESTEQRLANQTRVIRASGWLSEVKVDEIQSKIKEEENTYEPRIELQLTCVSSKDHRMKMMLNGQLLKICSIQ